jgi:hypothetical protein
MGSFKKFTANVESDNNGIIKLVHSEKMQVRPLENDNYVIEFKIKNEKIKFLKYEVKDLIEYLIKVTF